MREWGRIGCIGFGGPPAHIALLRALCVRDRGWLSEREFEDGVATVNLLPGPASTQLAIYCAWRLRGAAGALLGGACFILPGLAVILALAALFLQARPPGAVAAAALGAGAAVPAVALAAAMGLIPASWRRAGEAGSPARAPGRRAGEPGSHPHVPGRRSGEPGSQPHPPGRLVGEPGSQPHPPGRLVGEPGSQPRPPGRLARLRWPVYLAAGGVAGALLGPWLVLVLAACGLCEAVARARAAGATGPGVRQAGLMLGLAKPAALAVGGLGAVAWVAFKVGALSYGGGFVIIPLMQHDAVHTYHWLTAQEFLTAVALGQVTPGPVMQTVAVVGYAAAGVGGGLLAAATAFAPSFGFVLGGGPHFARVRGNARAQAFLTGAGPAAIGAIAGAAVPLGLALAHPWQAGVLAAAAVWLVLLRRGVVTGIAGAALLGVLAYLAGAPVT